MVHRSSSSVVSFLCVCFWSNSNNCTVPHKRIYKYVKYIAQGCCESVMEIFFKRLHVELMFTIFSGNLVGIIFKLFSQNNRRQMK